MTRLSVEQMRTIHGRSAAAWVGDGIHVVGDSHWIALSGARHVDYNLALCHGPGGADHIDECIDAINGGRRPGIIALAGEARASTRLAEAGWVRVGDAPMMTRGTEGAVADPQARLLTVEELPAARALVGEVFGLTPDIAEVAMSVDPGSIPNRSVWGLFDEGELKTAVLLMRYGKATVGWSMATDPRARRRGYGRRTVDTMLATTRTDGVEQFLMHSSAAGEPLYVAAGFEVVERWDFWSRPRWVLASR